MALQFLFRGELQFSWGQPPCRVIFSIRGTTIRDQLTLLAGKWTRNEDVCPIKNGGYSSDRYVSLPEGTPFFFGLEGTNRKLRSPRQTLKLMRTSRLVHAGVDEKTCETNAKGGINYDEPESGRSSFTY